MILIDDRPTPGPHGMDWFHMATDNLAAGGLQELFEMAEALGLRREWIHNHPRLPHFDVPPEHKSAAIRLGATEVTQRELVRRCRRRT